jgi:hypothetical protein
VARGVIAAQVSDNCPSIGLDPVDMTGMEPDISALRLALWVSALVALARHQPPYIDAHLLETAERLLRREHLRRSVLANPSLPC